LLQQRDEAGAEICKSKDIIVSLVLYSCHFRQAFKSLYF